MILYQFSTSCIYVYLLKHCCFALLTSTHIHRIRTTHVLNNNIIHVHTCIYTIPLHGAIVVLGLCASKSLHLGLMVCTVVYIHMYILHVYTALITGRRLHSPPVTDAIVQGREAKLAACSTSHTWRQNS